MSQDAVAQPASDSDESAAAEAQQPPQQPASTASAQPARPASSKSAVAKRRKKKLKGGGGRTADPAEQRAQPDGLAAEEDLDTILAELNLSQARLLIALNSQEVGLRGH